MSDLPQQVDVVIIGAGAAGLMAAITAGNRGRKVLVLDHANKVGKKILMSGGGRCNFTNMYTEPSNFLSGNAHFCKSALSRYTQWDFIEMVGKHNVAYHEKKLGQLFCDNKASDIVAMLLDECQQAKADIRLHCDIAKISDQSDGFAIQTSLGSVKCASLIVATGGLSIPTMGATGFGYKVAHQYGMTCLPTTAGLVPFTLTGGITGESKEQLAALAGNSLDVRISCNNMTFSEAMLFTHRGLSGPAVLQISSYWQLGQAVEVDLFPHLRLVDFLAQMQRERPKAELKSILGELTTKKLAQILCDLWCTGALASKAVNQYSPPELEAIAAIFHQWSFKPSGTEGYRTAEVTLGGVDTNELSSKTMEAKKRKGLYFVGEAMDVTGHLGGFNFQWAWASGFAAGSYV
tara:strand:+ start:1088 stop:2302 length:1215 start_codon:yes stop_codon:yes gene_type:complete